MTKEISHISYEEDGKLEQTFISVDNADIRIGEGLPYDIYNKHGLMVMPAGSRIKRITQLQQMLEAGLYRLSSDKKDVLQKHLLGESEHERHAFLMIDDAKTQVQNLFQHILAKRAHGIFVSQVRHIALHLQQASRIDKDATLASVHLDYDTPYIVQHSLHAALNIAIIADLLEIPEDKKLTMVCAAISHDVALLDIQNMLDSQEDQLTEEQWKRIHAHPQEGIELLKKLGVDDPIWLNAVLHHHERIDGSGYPLGINKADIKIPARLLAITDSYSAMVRQRPYRQAMVSKDVLRNLLFDESPKLDHRLVEILTKSCGIFPAGVMVKLANGEIAVVKKQGENISTPVVYAFIKPNGEPRFEPVLRHTNTPEFAIQGLIPLGKYHSHTSLLRHLWLKQ